MPGLIRGVARTAAIAGTATAVSNGVSRRQANRWAEKEQAAPAYMAPVGGQPQAAPPPAAAPGGGDMLEQLTKLGQLRDAGVLTPAEFEAQKAKILAAG
jgi:hypothetical protein